MFTLSINTDNAAFEDDRGAEVARILRMIADEVEGGVDRDSGHDGNGRDINGNTVGKWELV